MFFIMGISQGEKQLKFNQLVVCKCCGKYGQVDVFITYTYFMFFFILLFKWNRKYYVRMRCCNSASQIDDNLGKAIERGEVQEINLDELNFGGHNNQVRYCSNCGYVCENSEYEYCPKCGKQL